MQPNTLKLYVSKKLEAIKVISVFTNLYTSPVALPVTHCYYDLTEAITRQEN
jgi:hypothetical protein